MRQSSEESGAKHDWLGEVKQFTAETGDELELSSLLAGDRLQVKTRLTLYDFTWLKQGETDGLLTTDRIDRPLGKVRVVGCVLGRGSTIAPQRLFTGGSLEFTSEGGAWVHRTSRIVWIRMIRNLRA
jgi:hypothetical protein